MASSASRAISAVAELLLVTLMCVCVCVQAQIQDHQTTSGRLHHILLYVEPKALASAETKCTEMHTFEIKLQPFFDRAILQEGDAMALLAGQQTCDLQVAGSSLGWAPLHSLSLIHISEPTRPY